MKCLEGQVSDMIAIISTPFNANTITFNYLIENRLGRQFLKRFSTISLHIVCTFLHVSFHCEIKIIFETVREQNVLFQFSGFCLFTVSKTFDHSFRGFEGVFFAIQLVQWSWNKVESIT